MFLGLLTYPVATWTIAATTVAAMVVRPKRIPEAVWVCLGAALLLALHLVPLTQALGAIVKGSDLYLFLTGMMVLAELARREGVFDWLAGMALRVAAASRLRLFALVYLVGIAVTACLSNDATAAVLTPAVYAVLRKAKAEPTPYLFACALIDNAASFALSISNPANLVVFGDHLPALLPWLRVFLLPSCAAILMTYATLRLLFRKNLQGELAKVAAPFRLSSAGKVTALGVLGTAGVLLFCSAIDKPIGAPTCIIGVIVMPLALLSAVLALWCHSGLS